MCADSSSMLRAAEIKDERVKLGKSLLKLLKPLEGIYVLRF